MRNFLKTALITATAFFTSAALAGSSDEYKSLDSNQDGTISRSEATKNMDVYEQWKQLDANGDNMLDEGEFARFEVEPDTEEKPDAVIQ